MPTTYNFPPTSRYYGIETSTRTDSAGRVQVYIRRRFLPDPSRFALLVEHQVTEGERPDHVAAKYMDNAEAWWRFADANGVMRPEELTDTPGRRIRITLPEGIPGTQNA